MGHTLGRSFTTPTGWSHQQPCVQPHQPASCPSKPADPYHRQMSGPITQLGSGESAPGNCCGFGHAGSYCRLGEHLMVVLCKVGLSPSFPPHRHVIILAAAGGFSQPLCPVSFFSQNSTLLTSSIAEDRLVEKRGRETFLSAFNIYQVNCEDIESWTWVTQLRGRASNRLIKTTMLFLVPIEPTVRGMRGDMPKKPVQRMA